MKKTNGTSHWMIYHSSTGPKYGYLNLNNAFAIGSGEMWNYTEPNDHYVTLKGEPNTFGSATGGCDYVLLAQCPSSKIWHLYWCR